jgi:putative aldouronate transport system substrate-binding protein
MGEHQRASGNPMGRKDRPTTGDRPSDAAYSRRTVLRAAGAAAGLAGLAGRGTRAQSTPPPGGLVEGVDYFPSPMPGVPAAYLKPPAPFRSVAEVPGAGGTVTMFTRLGGEPIPLRDQNAHWQELERRLGVTLEPTFATPDAYGQQVATLVAGGALPDLFYVNPAMGAGSLYQVIEQGAFADLTDHLSGDALQAYPNLAGLEAQVWENVKIGGKIYGVPKPVNRYDNIPFSRADWAEALGLGAPADADAFAALLTGMARGDPDGNGQQDTWGHGGLGVDIVSRMFRAPNGWRLTDGGGLVHLVETEEYRQTLAFLRPLHEAGALHPEAPLNGQQDRDAFLAGQLGTHEEGFIPFFGATGLRVRVKELSRTPTARVEGLIPPGHDGGAGVMHNNLGFAGFVAIPAAAAQDEARLQELLRILDYLAAPDFSEEKIFLDLGLEGVHHTLGEDGARVLTEQGRSEIGANVLSYMVRREGQVFYFPGGPSGDAQEAQRLAAAILPLGVDNPTWGLVSPTNLEQGAILGGLVADAETGIVTGREPLDALDRLVADWRSRGGDQVRREYEEALAAQ